MWSDSFSFALSQNCFDYSSFFVVLYKFRIICSSSVKNAVNILIGITLNLQIALGNMDIIKILILLVHVHGIFFHFFVSSLISFISILQVSEYRSLKKVLVTQSCLTLCDPMDCSLPGSSVHGILQGRIVEWVAIVFSRGSSWPRDLTWVFCITVWATSSVKFIPRYIILFDVIVNELLS